jgi:hypothetical protein
MAQAQQLGNILQLQMQGMPMGLATPKHVYNTAAKLAENAGFKDVQSFFQDPSTLPPQPQQPPIELQIEQMKLQADQQKTQAQLQADIQKVQAQMQAKLQETQANLELQAANDQRDSEREAMKARYDAELEQQRLQFDKWRAEFEAQTKIYIEEMKLRGVPPDDFVQQQQTTMQILSGLDTIMRHISAPKMIIRDANGRAVGVQHVTGA